MLRKAKMSTRVVKIKRSEGVVIQFCDIYIGRACNRGGWNLPQSKWHNPFTVKEHGTAACALYETYIRASPLIHDIEELRGKILGCWCSPNMCHGDILCKILGERRVESKDEKIGIPAVQLSPSISIPIVSFPTGGSSISVPIVSPPYPTGGSILTPISPASPPDGGISIPKISLCSPESKLITLKSVPGLILVENLISEKMERALLAEIEKIPDWKSIAGRLAKHYGFRYEFKGGHVVQCQAFPKDSLLMVIRDVLEQKGYMKANQVTIGKYLRKHGITPHIDNSLFGPKIIGVNLGHPINIIFKREGYTPIVCDLPPRSMYVMTGESRTLWTHEIPFGETYMVGNVIHVKPEDYARVNLTFRDVI